MNLTKDTSTVKHKLIFATANVVIIANELNLSIFKLGWLCQFGVLKLDEILEGAVFTQQLVNVPTRAGVLTIIPNRLQFGFRSPTAENSQQVLVQSLGAILRNLPHTPLVALGINFDFFMTPENPVDFHPWNQRAFASPVALKTSPDETHKPRFGSYWSGDFEGVRLKIDAKPVLPSGIISTLPPIVEALRKEPHWMHITFNYHKDIPNENGAAEALAVLPKYDEFVAHSQSLIQSINEY